MSGVLGLWVCRFGRGVGAGPWAPLDPGLLVPSGQCLLPSSCLPVDTEAEAVRWA